MEHNQVSNFTLHNFSMEQMAKLGCPSPPARPDNHGPWSLGISGHPIKRRSFLSSPICFLSRNSTFSRFTKSQKFSISWIITRRWIWTVCYFSIYCRIKKLNYCQTNIKIKYLNQIMLKYLRVPLKIQRKRPFSRGFWQFAFLTEFQMKPLIIKSYLLLYYQRTSTRPRQV